MLQLKVVDNTMKEKAMDHLRNLPINKSAFFKENK